MDTREIIHRNLTYYLEKSEYSQAEIARLLGVSKTSVTKWVKGINSPSIDLLGPLCNLLHITFLDVFEEHPEMVQKPEPPTVLSADEQQLIDDYRSLNEQGQEYIRQTMYMAKQTHKKMPDLSDLEKQA